VIFLLGKGGKYVYMGMRYNDQLGLHAFTNLNNTKQLQQMS